MPTLTIKHTTIYRYRQPVTFGEHRMMLRPLQSHDQRLIDAKLVITPAPTNIRRGLDAFGNHVDIVRFAGRAKELRFDSTIRLDQSYTDVHDLDIEEFARTYPFSYRRKRCRTWSVSLNGIMSTRIATSSGGREDFCERLGQPIPASF